MLTAAGDCSKTAKGAFEIPRVIARSVSHMCVFGGVGCVFREPAKQEQTMGNQARLWRAMVTASAVALAAGMSITTRAQAHSLGNGMGTGYHAAPGVADEGSSIDSADPIDDGSIVIECVAWAGMRNGETAETAFTPRLASMPQRRLGPTKCWPRKHKQVP
jgi:hypothetical protein